MESSNKPYMSLSFCMHASAPPPGLPQATMSKVAGATDGQAGTAHLLCGLLQSQPLGKGLALALEGADVDALLAQVCG